MIGKREWIGSAIMVAAIVAAALAANKALDNLDIANEPGATIEQRKERARERQWDWDHRRERRSEGQAPVYQSAAIGKPDQMCADPRVVAITKSLINDQYPSAAKIGKVMAALEAARPKRTIEEERKSIEEQTTLWTSMSPRPEAKEELKKLEARAERLRERQKLENEGAQAQRAPPPEIPDNEIVVSGQPYPIEYDGDLKRVACRIQYRITGPGTETINALQGNALSSATFTAQPEGDGWIVELLSVPDLN